MRVLVTGAAGRLGSVVVPTLRAIGYDVVAADRRPGEGITVCDLSDLTALIPLCRGADAVVHLATSRWTEPPPLVLANILTGTSHVVSACLATGIRRVVFASSIQVIAPEGSPRLEVAYLPLDGASPPNPRNAYSAAKTAAEILLQEASTRHGLQVTNLRFPLLEARVGDGPWGRALKPWAGHERTADLAGGLSCLSFQDAARLIVEALRAGLPGFRTYLPALSVVAPVLIPDYVARYYPGVELRVPVERMVSLIDLSALEHDFGWRPLDFPVHPPPDARPARPSSTPPGPPSPARHGALPGLAWLRRLIADRRVRRALARIERVPGLTFSADHISGHLTNWEVLFREFRGRPGVRFLEVGSYEGRSALWFLQNILTDPGSRLTCVDPFEDPVVSARFAHNLRSSGAGDRVVTLAGSSSEVLPTLPRGSFDAVYIDGSHAARDVLLDALLAWTLLKPGGILLFDDYRWGAQLRPSQRPQMAIDLFLEAFEDRLELLLNDYQVAVRKL